MNFKQYYLNEKSNKIGFLNVENKDPNFVLQNHLNDINKSVELLNKFYKPKHLINLYFYDFEKQYDEIHDKFKYDYGESGKADDYGYAFGNNILINTNNITDFILTLIHEIGHVLYSEISQPTRRNIMDWYENNIKNKLIDFKREKLSPNEINILWNEFIKEPNKTYKEKLKELRDDIFYIVKQRDENFQKDALPKIERYLTNNFRNFNNINEKMFKEILSKINISSERANVYGTKSQELEKQKLIPSMYSATNPEEMFSELLAYYLIDVDKLDEVSKKFMDGIINILKKENI